MHASENGFLSFFAGKQRKTERTPCCPVMFLFPPPPGLGWDHGRTPTASYANFAPDSSNFLKEKSAETGQRGIKEQRST